MDRQEIINTRYGEMLDMIACLSIYNGGAQPKKKKKIMSYDDVINMR